MSAADTLSHNLALTGQAIKSMVKILLQSRIGARPRTNPGPPLADTRLLILGNGPSLRADIDSHFDLLASHPTLAVNFMANTDDFYRLRPRYYLLMDPHFFRRPVTDPNLGRLFDNMARRIDWPMTMFLPAGRSLADTPLASNPHITVEYFNPTGVEGPAWLEDAAYSSRMGMPRPHNVLIPSVMVGIWLGYKRIGLLGADHSWLRTLDVDDDNHVVSVQPHFYADGKEELRRVSAVFRDKRLHDVLYGFQMAFRSYHRIARHLAGKDTAVVNCTPGSYIDAFPRASLSDFCDGSKP